MNKLLVYILILTVTIYACTKDTPIADEVVTTATNDFPNDGAIVISDNITTDTILRNHKAGVDYRIAICLKVINGATITIEPGVEIEMTPGSSMELMDNAHASWVGTANAKIKFYGTEKNAGSWRGIYFHPSNKINKLQYCEVQHAGNEYYKQQRRAAINVYSTQVQLDYCVISNNKSHALYLDSGAVSMGINNCTFTANGAEPIMVEHTNSDILTSNNAYTGNTTDQILIACTHNTYAWRNLHYTKLNIPYSIDGNFRTAAHITIDQGCQFIIRKLSIILIDGATNTLAGITAIGALNDSIKLKGALPQKGYWQGIGLINGASANLQYCSIAFCGFVNLYNSLLPQAMVHVGGTANASCNIRNCTFGYTLENAIAIDTNYVNYNSDMPFINAFDSITKDTLVLY